MPADVDIFDQLPRLLADSGLTTVLDRLAETLEVRREYHELFEALKMRVRFDLGLPLRFADTDELDGPLREALEQGLVDACRRVGLLLLGEGRVREAWMYLRAVGDRPAVAEAMARLPDPEQNLDEWIEVLLHEAVDPRRGLSLVLRHCGTCDGITALESAMHRMKPAEQQAAAGALVEHVYHELLAAIQAHVARQQTAAGEAAPIGAAAIEAATLETAVANQPWLFESGACHIDATHLAATVRLARVLDRPDQVRLAWELTQYGQRLDRQLQYPDAAPFTDTYAAHALFFAACLGQRVEEAVAYFGGRAAADRESGQTLALDTYVRLLERLGRHAAAMQVLIEHAERDAQPARWAPMILSMAAKAGCYEQAVAFSKRHGDLLGYAASLAEAHLARPS